MKRYTAVVVDQTWRRVEEKMAIPLPATWSPIRTLLVASNSFLWAENVESVSPATFEVSSFFGPLPVNRPDGTVWDLFDEAGTFQGQVNLPPRFEPMAVRGFQVTGVLKDDLDVEYVVTYGARSLGVEN